MGLFGFSSRKAATPPDPRIVDELYERACGFIQDQDGRIHVEDLISALAAATGEACLRQIGQIDIDNPDNQPGALVFSDAVNALLCADAEDWAGAPPNSIFGLIHRAALAGGYDADAFPPLREVFAGFARGQGSVPWGWVPLSCESRPFMPPLQAAYELRPRFYATWITHKVGAAEQTRQAALALAKAMVAVKAAIDPRHAVLIALETLNGMAKTIPVNAAHMAGMKAEAAASGPPA